MLFLARCTKAPLRCSPFRAMSTANPPLPKTFGTRCPVNVGGWDIEGVSVAGQVLFLYFSLYAKNGLAAKTDLNESYAVTIARNDI
jgi:hypothetical protein